MYSSTPSYILSYHLQPTNRVITGASAKVSGMPAIISAPSGGQPAKASGVTTMPLLE